MTGSDRDSLITRTSVQDLLAHRSATRSAWFELSAQSKQPLESPHPELRL